MASLVDTSILVYRCDPRDPVKREVAVAILREGQLSGEFRIAHQALVEFVNAVTRLRGRTEPIMTPGHTTRQAELFIAEFPVIYPNEHVFRAALAALAMYRLPWYDAHLWAYALHYGIGEILSEDFEHGRMYGPVRVKNPFVALGLA